jgi:hypothetical protein
MKVICPKCNVQGILQVRGNSKRIVHYRWVDGVRVFSYHKLDTVGHRMDTVMDTEKTENSILSQNRSNKPINNLEDISVAG